MLNNLAFMFFYITTCSKFYCSMISEPLSPAPLLVCSVIFVMCLISTILMTALYKPWTMKMATPPPPPITMATGKPPVHTVISVKVSVYFYHFIICHHFYHHFNHHHSSSSLSVFIIFITILHCIQLLNLIFNLGIHC